MGKTILGLDISSKVVGFSLIEECDGKFKLNECDYYEPLPTTGKKAVSLFESLLKLREKVEEILCKYEPDEVAIEDISEFFSGKGSSSKTIIKLAVYNRTIGLKVFEHTKKEPKLLNVNTVRSIIKPKGYKGRLSKEDVPEVVAAILKIEFPYIYKKTGKIADENYDMADSIAVALAHGALSILEEEKDNES